MENNVPETQEQAVSVKTNKLCDSKFGKAVGLKPDTSVKTEIIAGITTFFAMCYILIVNPNQITGFYSYLGGEVAKLWQAVYVGTILAAVIGTLLYAFLAKKPFAQASGMGLNSFFFTSFILPAAIANENGEITGFNNLTTSYGAGLVIILISGLIFLLLSVTGLRSYIAKSLPDCLKKAIPAGIGLFIALLGFKGAFIVTDNPYTFVQLGDLTKWKIYNSFGELAGGAAPFLAAFLGLISIVIFNKLGIKILKNMSVVLGILVSTILFYLFTWTAPSFSFNSIGESFSAFGEVGLSMFNGASWSAAFDGTTIGTVFSVIVLIITFCLVDMFDTIGTLYGASAQAGMLDENGDPDKIEQCMLCDSIATCAGAMLGTSTVTTYVESASGVAEGGRTGLTALVTAILFLACLVLTPLASIIPGVATAPALIYVGVLMLKNFKAIDMDDLANAVPAFLTLILMPLTYSISNGIAVGAIAYVLIRLFTGKYNKKDIVVTVIAALFILRFALVNTL
ncbi:MAG: NCS2 family permease [Clostridiales bacterium]|nr:NCS2 family permease [Clostridiales bacterium]